MSHCAENDAGLPAEKVAALADELGRRRDPRDHSPTCADGSPCSYCTDLAEAIAPLIAVWLLPPGERS